ncbi:steroidogenic acute regulatory protein, mitochondrial [Lampetra fluviatilis]
MLPATFKLCCGTSYQHCRTLTGVGTRRLVRTAIQHDALGSLARHASSALGSLRAPGGGGGLHRFLPALGESASRGGADAAAVSDAELRYLSQGREALQRVLSILDGGDGGAWHSEGGEGQGDSVSSKVLPDIGKVFKLEADVPGSVDQLHAHLFEQVERMCEWNPNVQQVKVLQRIGQRTLVTHDVAADAAGNLVKARDFVNLRHSIRRGSTCYLVGVSTHSDSAPPQDAYIRGETGPSLIMLRPSAKDPSKTHIIWLLNIDLKGWLPKSLINRALSRMQLDFATSLRARMLQPPHVSVAASECAPFIR